MKLEFGYGQGIQSVTVPDEDLITVLTANPMKHERRGAEAVEYALDHPIGAPALSGITKKGMKAVIVTSDISRPMPSREVLPSVIGRLNEAGIPDADITVVFALGSHRKHTEEEKKHLAGEEVFARIRCEDSSDSGFVHLGVPPWRTQGRGHWHGRRNGGYLSCIGNERRYGKKHIHDAV